MLRSERGQSPGQISARWCSGGATMNDHGFLFVLRYGIAIKIQPQVEKHLVKFQLHDYFKGVSEIHLIDFLYLLKSVLYYTGCILLCQH